MPEKKLHYEGKAVRTWDITIGVFQLPYSVWLTQTLNAKVESAVSPWLNREANTLSALN